MSKKKRQLEKEKKKNSPKAKAKRAKKEYYASPEAAAKWDDKQERKEQSKLNERVSKGVSKCCTLYYFEDPSPRRCKGCKFKCPFNQ